MKPVHGSDPPQRVAAPERRAAVPTPHIEPSSMAAATRGAAPSLAEQDIKSAVVELRDTLARLKAEPDLLVRRLGLRQLVLELDARPLSVDGLSRSDEQDHARALLREVATEERRATEVLPPEARIELEILLRFTERVEQRRDAAARRDAVLAATAGDLEELQQLTQLIALEESRVRRLPRARPSSAATSGTLLTAAAVAVVIVVLLVGARPDASPAAATSSSVAAGRVLALVAVAAIAAAWWFFWAPAWRQRRSADRLERLRARHTAIEARSAEARAALARALELFERVDAECRAEETAAAAVLRRHPGAQRYVQRDV